MVNVCVCFVCASSLTILVSFSPIRHITNGPIASSYGDHCSLCELFGVGIRYLPHCLVTSLPHAVDILCHRAVPACTLCRSGSRTIDESRPHTRRQQPSVFCPKCFVYAWFSMGWAMFPWRHRRQLDKQHYSRNNVDNVANFVRAEDVVQPALQKKRQCIVRH